MLFRSLSAVGEESEEEDRPGDDDHSPPARSKFADFLRQPDGGGIGSHRLRSHDLGPPRHRFDLVGFRFRWSAAQIEHRRVGSDILEEPEALLPPYGRGDIALGIFAVAEAQGIDWAGDHAGGLQASVEELGAIGATPAGGVSGPALSDADKAGRDWLVARMEQLGLAVTVDAMGNIFGRRTGRDDALPVVAMGSHIDTVPRGGRFDGALGVLSALEVVAVLNDTGAATPAPGVVWFMRFLSVQEQGCAANGSFGLVFPIHQSPPQYLADW